MPEFCEDCKLPVEPCGWGAEDCNNPETPKGDIHTRIARAVLGGPKAVEALLSQTSEATEGED